MKTAFDRKQLIWGQGEGIKSISRLLNDERPKKTKVKRRYKGGWRGEPGGPSEGWRGRGEGIFRIKASEGKTKESPIMGEKTDTWEGHYTDWKLQGGLR